MNKCIQLFTTILCILMLALITGCDSGTTEGNPAEDATPSYDIDISVHYESNLFFNTYDADIYLDDDYISSITQSDTYTDSFTLEEGQHTISFQKTDDENIKSSTSFTLIDDSIFSCNISAKKDTIEISDKVFQTLEEYQKSIDKAAEETPPAEESSMEDVAAMIQKDMTLAAAEPILNSYEYAVTYKLNGEDCTAAVKNLDSAAKENFFVKSATADTGFLSSKSIVIELSCPALDSLKSYTNKDCTALAEKIDFYNYNATYFFAPDNSNYTEKLKDAYYEVTDEYVVLDTDIDCFNKDIKVYVNSKENIRQENELNNILSKDSLDSSLEGYLKDRYGEDQFRSINIDNTVIKDTDTWTIIGTADMFNEEFAFSANATGTTEIPSFSNITCTDGNKWAAKCIALKKVTGVKISKLEARTVKLKWNKISGVTGYKVYRKKVNKDEYSSSDGFELVKTLSSPNKTTVTFEDLTTSSRYTYYVIAYAENDYDTYKGNPSKKVSIIIKPSKPSGIKSSSTTSSIKLSWNDDSKASGYKIYKKNNEGKYKLVKTTTSSSYSRSDLKSNKTYYFKIKKYVKYGDKKYYGPSAKKSVTTKAKKKSTSTSSKKKSSQSSGSSNIIVYGSATGDHYHSYSCRYANHNYDMTLTEAQRKGLSPCGVCHPLWY